MQTTGKITDIGLDISSRKAKISLVLDTNDLGIVEKLKNENRLNIELKKYRKQRSSDANSYCWVLCDKIAKTMQGGISKEDIYKDAISYVGTFEPMIIEEKAFEKFKDIWQKQGLGYLVKEVSRKDKCIKVFAYYGSSSYDSKEMSKLIEFIVEQAKGLNIETLSDEEVKSLLESWDKK